MRIAIAHMRTKLLSKKVNLERVKRFALEAKRRRASILLLPSMFNTGSLFEFYSSTRLRRALRSAAEKIPGPTTEHVVSLAMDAGLYIMGGPIIERAGPKLFLTAFAVSPTGTVQCKFRKMFPGESDLGISPGKDITIANTIANVGMLVEDDVMLPEIARGMAFLGANFFVALARLKTGGYDYTMLAYARSVENMVPTIQVGGLVEHRDKVEAVVPSYYISPENGVSLLADEGEKLITVDLKLHKKRDNPLLRRFKKPKDICRFYSKKR